MREEQYGLLSLMGANAQLRLQCYSISQGSWTEIISVKVQRRDDAGRPLYEGYALFRKMVSGFGVGPPWSGKVLFFCQDSVK